MGKPFYKSAKFVNRLAAAIGILAVIIFVSANLVSIHAYYLHPTPTQTPSPTATVTKTPRPSLTPTATPTFLVEYSQVSDLIIEMTARGYLCQANQQLEGMLELVCNRKLAGTNIHYELTLSKDALFDQQILIEPFTASFVDAIYPELTWLAQIPFLYPWLLIPLQATVTFEPAITINGSQTTASPVAMLSETPAITPWVTPEIKETLLYSETPSVTPEIETPSEQIPEQIAIWLLENRAKLSMGEPIRQTFNGLEYSIVVMEKNLFLRVIPASH